MPESSFWHVSKPAPIETDIGWSNLEGVFQEPRLQVKSEGRTKPNKDYA
jgi:hypothetical protein